MYNLSFSLSLYTYIYIYICIHTYIVFQQPVLRKPLEQIGH